MPPFTLKNRMDRYCFKHLCIVIMIISLIQCTVIADEIMEKKDLKSINGITKADKTFYVLYDNENERFEKTIEYKKGEEKSIYKISRINIDGPYYDGIMGYNVVKIRKESFPAPIDVLTFMVRGQYQLFGYDVEKNKIYAYRAFQLGAYFLINDITAISKKKGIEKNRKYDKSLIPEDITVEIIETPGEYYYYASCSPDGKYCILFGAEKALIDLQTKSVVKKDLGISYPTPGCLEYDIVEYDLSGDYMEMKWETNTSGKLICRDKNKKVVKVIKIDIKKYK